MFNDRFILVFLLFNRKNLSLIQQLARIRVKPLIRIVTVFTEKRSGNKQQQFIFITIVLILLYTMLLGYYSVFSLYSSNSYSSIQSACCTEQDTVRQNILVGSIGIARSYRPTHYLESCQDSLAALHRLDHFNFYSIPCIWLLFFHFYSCLYWKSIFYHIAGASNKTNQNDRDR